MKIISYIKSKALVGIVGFLVAVLALPFGSASVYADQANGYWLTTTTSANPASVYLNGTSPDVSTVSVNVRGRDQSSPYGSDVVLIIDASDSMSGQATTDEIIAAKSFINSMDSTSDQASVIPFANYAPQSPESIQTLTTDFTAAKNYIDNVDNLTTLGASTNYESALNAANAEFSSARARADANKVLIFMSDGAPNGSSNIATMTTAMKASGINIYTIGLDSSSGHSGLSSTASDLLKSMASSTNGTDDHYFEAPTSDQLTSIYTSISQSIANLVATNVQLTLKLSSSVALVADSWSIVPTSSTNGLYVFDLPDALSNRTTALTFQVKIPKGTLGQSVKVLDTTESIINYTDALSVASTVAVNNVDLAITTPPVITAPNTAVQQFITANPFIVAILGIITAVVLVFATRRQFSKR